MVRSANPGPIGALITMTIMDTSQQKSHSADSSERITGHLGCGTQPNSADRVPIANSLVEHVAAESREREQYKLSLYKRKFNE